MQNRQPVAGNEGTQLELWYQCAALVLWRPSLQPQVAAEQARQGAEEGEEG